MPIIQSNEIYQSNVQGEQNMAIINLHAVQPVAIVGNIIDNNDHTITIQYNKPRTSKQLQETILKTNVLAVTASDEDMESEIIVMRREVYASYEGDVTVNEDGTITVTGEGFEVTIHDTDDVEFAVEEVVEEAPKAKGKKAPAKAAPAKGKKAPPVEEEEDNDNEDEAEAEAEEEAPAPKKGKAPVKKAPAKKAKEEDEDEDW